MRKSYIGINDSISENQQRHLQYVLRKNCFDHHTCHHLSRVGVPKGFIPDRLSAAQQIITELLMNDLGLFLQPNRVVNWLVPEFRPFAFELARPFWI